MSSKETSNREDALDFFSESLFSLFGVHSPARGNPGASLVYFHPLLPPIRSSSQKGPDEDAQIVFEIPNHDGANTKLFAHLQWDAGWELANEIVACAAQGQPSQWADVRGKSCVEVGAGTGLPSLVAHRLGAHRVVVTDYPDEGILSKLRRNSTGQAANLMQDTPIVVAGLSWGDSDQERSVHALSPDGNGFDVVIAADTLWMSSTHALLLRSLLTLVSRQGRILLAAGYHSGIPCVRRFFDLCDQGIKGLGRLVPDEAAGPAGHLRDPNSLTNIVGVWEKNIPSGEIRPWKYKSAVSGTSEHQEGLGSIDERAQWCVMACLKWAPTAELKDFHHAK